MIIPVDSLEAVKPLLDTLIRPGSLIFLDVDDTVITPQDAIFRANSPHARFIDELKAKNKEARPEDQALFLKWLGHWRRVRPVMLVEKNWPQVTQEWQTAGALVYGLTKVDTKACGPIENMPKWRAEELAKMGIEFTQSCKGIAEGVLPIPAVDKEDGAHFHKGIFLTGCLEKEVVLGHALAKLKPSQPIVIIDDRLTILEKLDYVFGQQYPLKLYHYQKAGQLIGNYDPKLAAHQMALFRQGKWISDQAFKS